MTLDEAIQYYKKEADKYYEYGIETECYQCGKEHEQLAEWLTELKEAKRLLHLVLSDINTDSCCSNCFSCKYLGGCDHSERYEWKHTDEVLKLLGGSENEGS